MAFHGKFREFHTKNTAEIVSDYWGIRTGAPVAA